MLNIGVLISGGGSNLQAIIDDCESKKINGNIKVVISNREDAFGLERAKKHNIRSVFEKDEDEVIKILKEENVDLVVLAGYLKIISPKFVSEFENKMTTTIKHRKLNRKVSYRYFIRLECYKLIKHFIGDEKYKVLKAWW